jgi:hypothetical protein
LISATVVCADSLSRVSTRRSLDDGAMGGGGHSAHVAADGAAFLGPELAHAGPAAAPARRRPAGRSRRLRPAHVLGAALALTAAVMIVGAPAPWPESHAAATAVGVGGSSETFGNATNGPGFDMGPLQRLLPPRRPSARVSPSDAPSPIRL